jgi:hypothetical protein
MRGRSSAVSNASSAQMGTGDAKSRSVSSSVAATGCSSNASRSVREAPDSMARRALSICASMVAGVSP